MEECNRVICEFQVVSLLANGYQLGGLLSVISPGNWETLFSLLNLKGTINSGYKLGGLLYQLPEHSWQGVSCLVKGEFSEILYNGWQLGCLVNLLSVGRWPAIKCFVGEEVFIRAIRNSYQAGRFLSKLSVESWDEAVELIGHVRLLEMVDGPGKLACLLRELPVLTRHKFIESCRLEKKISLLTRDVFQLMSLVKEIEINYRCHFIEAISEVHFSSLFKGAWHLENLLKLFNKNDRLVVLTKIKKEKLQYLFERKPYQFQEVKRQLPESDQEAFSNLVGDIGVEKPSCDSCSSFCSSSSQAFFQPIRSLEPKSVERSSLMPRRKQI